MTERHLRVKNPKDKQVHSIGLPFGETFTVVEEALPYWKRHFWSWEDEHIVMEMEDEKRNLSVDPKLPTKIEAIDQPMIHLDERIARVASPMRRREREENGCLLFGKFGVQLEMVGLSIVSLAAPPLFRF